MQKGNTIRLQTNTINGGGHGVNSTMMDSIVDGTNYSDNKYDALFAHIVWWYSTRMVLYHLGQQVYPFILQ